MPLPNLCQFLEDLYERALRRQAEAQIYAPRRGHLNYPLRAASRRVDYVQALRECGPFFRVQITQFTEEEQELATWAYMCLGDESFDAESFGDVPLTDVFDEMATQNWDWLLDHATDAVHLFQYILGVRLERRFLPYAGHIDAILARYRARVGAAAAAVMPTGPPVVWPSLRGEACVICGDGLPDCVTECSHLFHYECLRCWQTQGGPAGRTCPLCRREYASLAPVRPPKLRVQLKPECRRR